MVLIVLVYLSNDVYRIIFGFKAFEPVKELIYFMQHIDFWKL